MTPRDTDIEKRLLYKIAALVTSVQQEVEKKELPDYFQSTVSIGFVTLALVLIDNIFPSSHEYWLFSVAALIAWSVANFVYEKAGTQMSNEPLEFLCYSIVVIVASAVGAFVVQQIMAIVVKGSEQSANAQSIDFATVVFLSLVASAVAYAVPNIPIWLARRQMH